MTKSKQKKRHTSNVIHFLDQKNPSITSAPKHATLNEESAIHEIQKDDNKINIEAIKSITANTVQFASLRRIEVNEEEVEQKNCNAGRKSVRNLRPQWSTPIKIRSQSVAVQTEFPFVEEDYLEETQPVDETLKQKLTQELQEISWRNIGFHLNLEESESSDDDERSLAPDAQMMSLGKRTFSAKAKEFNPIKLVPPVGVRKPLAMKASAQHSSNIEKFNLTASPPSSERMFVPSENGSDTSYSTVPSSYTSSPDSTKMAQLLSDASKKNSSFKATEFLISNYIVPKSGKFIRNNTSSDLYYHLSPHS